MDGHNQCATDRDRSSILADIRVDHEFEQVVIHQRELLASWPYFDVEGDPEFQHNVLCVDERVVSFARIIVVYRKFGTFEGQIVTGAEPFESAVTVSVDLSSIDTGTTKMPRSRRTW